MSFEDTANQFLAREGVNKPVQDTEQVWLSQKPVSFDLLADQFLARERVQNTLQAADQVRICHQPKQYEASVQQPAPEKPRLKRYLALLLHPQG
jgi:hypothetical protein